jgi:hypothetical protein
MKSFIVLKFKLASEADLQAIADLCRKARNVAAENWLLRQRGMPETERQSKRLIKSKHGDKPKSESTKLYHAVIEKAPELGTFAVSMIAKQVGAYLNGKVDWRRGMEVEGRRAKRKDAILSYEDRPPFFTATEIPLHNKQCTVEMGDESNLTVSRLLRGAEPLILTISLRDMPPSFKRILLELSQEKRKLADSKLLEKDGEWYWFLPVAFEQPEANPEIIVTLSPVIPSVDGDPERPFQIVSESRPLPWFIGDGRYLLRQTARIEAMIKAIGWRYRQRNGAGHGRKKIDAAVMLRRKQLRNIVNEVRRRMIKDVVNQAKRQEAGVVLFREPTGPAKTKCWFERSGVTWDWTRFVGDLKNSLAKHGIELRIQKLKIGEIVKAEKEKKDAA